MLLILVIAYAIYTEEKFILLCFKEETYLKISIKDIELQDDLTRRAFI